MSLYRSSAMVKSLRYRVTGASRETLPCSASFSTAAGGVDLADGADAVELVPGHQQVLRPGEGAGLAGEDDLPVLPQDALSQSGRRRTPGRKQRRCPPGSGGPGPRWSPRSRRERRLSAARAGTDRLRARRRASTRALQRVVSVFISSSFPAPKGDCAGRSGVMTVSGYASRAGRSSKNFDRLAEW